MEQQLERNKAFERALADAGLDALLVVRDTNQRFLEGFTGSECYLLAAARQSWLVADSRYSEQGARECRRAQVILHRNPHPPYQEVIAGLAKEHGLARIGFEKAVLTYEQYETLAEGLKAVPGAQLVPAAGIVERLRMVKEAGELERISHACAIADRALEVTLGKVRAGMSELELARELEHQMAEAGAEGLGFATIVAFGAHASMPHAVPDPAIKLAPGDLILIDYGAMYQGYRSDTTRTVVFGKPSQKQKDAYAAVLESQAAGIAATHPGAAGREPDVASRAVLTAHGLPEFSHGLGHGVGLDIHEMPSMNRTGEEILRPGMVVTVEPGLYLPDWGGIRIEDTVVVTETGCRCLTHFPKDTLLEV